MQLTPTQSHERIASIDIIRGFALFGILLVNMPAFHSPQFLMSLYGVFPDYSGIDFLLHLLFTLFIHTKFYTIFSFLFGLGFYIFMKRADTKGYSTNLLFFKRLVILLIFGLLHLIFLWYGDILHTYAITGILLLFFYKRSNKTILSWAFVLLFLYHAFISLPFIIPEPVMNEINQEDWIAYSSHVVDYLTVYQEEDYVDWVVYRSEVELTHIIQNIPFSIPTVLSMFLLGLYAGRKGFFSKDTLHLGLIKKVQITTLVLSIPIVTYLTLILVGLIDLGGYRQITEFLFTSLSGMILSLFYISSLIILLRKEKWEKALQPLGYVGQMALTNYIGQTVITMGIIFGFNLYGDISLTIGTILSVAIFTVQIIFSKFWLKTFRYGPLEWVWRSLTYGKKQPLYRKDKKVT